MIELTETGRRLILAALRSASTQIGLHVLSDDGFSEPKNERYARIDAGPESWVSTDTKIAGPTVEFMFSAPVGMVSGWFVADSSGEPLFVDRFKRPYDFSQFGGRLRVLPAFEITPVQVEE